MPGGVGKHDNPTSSSCRKDTISGLRKAKRRPSGARKGNQSFVAYTGPELLGLVVLREQLGDNWNQQTPDVYSELADKIDD